MILRVINHPYEFDMKNLCITFFPHEKIRLEGEEDPVEDLRRRHQRRDARRLLAHEALRHDDAHARAAREVCP